MSNALETVQLNNGEVIEIFQDENPDDPRSWDNLGHLINFHDRYNLGDENTSKSKLEDEMNADKEYGDETYFEKWADVERYLIEKRGAINVLPLMLHDHSGLSMYVGTTGDRWDSMPVGYIYTTEERIQKWGAQLKDVDMILRGEVDTMDKYLRGEVYGWQIVKYVTCDHGDQHREVIDSSWGYHSMEEAIKEAKGAVSYAS
jgi:hypothetical protein